MGRAFGYKFDRSDLGFGTNISAARMWSGTLFRIWPLSLGLDDCEIGPHSQIAWRYFKPGLHSFMLSIARATLRAAFNLAVLSFLDWTTFPTCLQPDSWADHDLLKSYVHWTLNGIELRRAVLAQCSLKLFCVLCSPTDKKYPNCPSRLSITDAMLSQNQHHAWCVLWRHSWGIALLLFLFPCPPDMLGKDCLPISLPMYITSAIASQISSKKRRMDVWGRAGIIPCHLAMRPSLDGVAEAAGLALQCHFSTVVYLLWWEENLPYPLLGQPSSTITSSKVKDLMIQASQCWKFSCCRCPSKHTCSDDTAIFVHIITTSSKVFRSWLRCTALTLRPSEPLRTVEALSSLQQWFRLTKRLFKDKWISKPRGHSRRRDIHVHNVSEQCLSGSPPIQYKF